MTAAGGTEWAHAVDACPKTMAHGPCAGVSPEGLCEVPDAGRCTFVDLLEPQWPYPPAAAPAAVAAASTPTPDRRERPIVVADVPAAALSADSLRTVATVLAGAVDAGLLGDHGLARVQFPPSYRVRVLTEAGLPAWAGLNCRDRSRVALEGELAACLDAGAVGLHCVTGDHPARDGRPDRLAVFDLDALGLVDLAAGAAVPAPSASVPSAARRYRCPSPTHRPLRPRTSACPGCSRRCGPARTPSSSTTAAVPST